MNHSKPDMRNFESKLGQLWQKIMPHAPDDDPLKADTQEYMDAGEWGIACEAMAILAKRYGQYAAVSADLEPLMEYLILNEEDDADLP